jgi:hypothetical protein
MSYLYSGAAVAAGTSYLGGKAEQKGMKDARKSMEQGIEVGREAGQLADPFQEYRPGYAAQLNDILQGKRDFRTDPGYRFVYDEAMQGTRRQMAAGGYQNSGNMYTALQNRAAGLASQQYGSIMDRLTNLAGAGSQNAVSGAQIYGNTNMQAMQGIADLHAGAGASQAGMIGKIGGVLGNVVGSFG